MPFTSPSVAGMARIGATVRQEVHELEVQKLEVQELEVQDLEVQ